MLLNAVLFSTLASMVSAAITLATPPSLVQCQPVSLSWEGGEPPFILSAIPGGQTGAEPLLYITNDAKSSPYTWVVNLPVGVQVNVKVVDGTGAYQFTSPLTVQKGATDACLNPPAGSSAPPSTDAPATEAPATEAPATEAPATEAPATEAPSTETAAPTESVPPTSAAPTESAPVSSAAPSSVAPSSAVPSVNTTSVAATTSAASKPAATTTPAATHTGAASMNMVAVPAIAAAVAGALLF